MNKYIIAIGGTGIKCFESFLYLNAVNGLEHDEECKYEVLIVDSDANGNYKALQGSAIGYSKLRNVFRDSKKKHGQRPFANEFSARDDDKRIRNWRIVENPSETNIAQLINEDKNVKGLLEVLYCPGRDEMNMTYEEGVHGKPKVGSLVIDYYLEKKMNDKDSEWGRFVNKINEDLAKCSKEETLDIIILGSVFGGTGASGLRTIANKIIEHEYTVNQNQYNCRQKIANKHMNLSVLMMVPYFELPQASIDEDNFGLSDINANTAYALDFYSQDTELLNQVTAIVVGKSNYDKIIDVYEDADKDSTEFYSEGGEKQKNRALLPELIAAFAMDKFFSGEFSKGELYYLARDEDEDYTVDWMRLPETNNFKSMLLNMIVFSMIYRKKIYPVLSEDNRDVFHHPWQGICISDMNKKGFHDDAKAINIFAENFLRWATNISAGNIKNAHIDEEYKLLDTDFIKQAFNMKIDKIEDHTSLNNIVYEHSGRRISWANIHDQINKLGITKAKKVLNNKKDEYSLDLLINKLYSTIQKLN